MRSPVTTSGVAAAIIFAFIGLVGLMALQPSSWPTLEQLQAQERLREARCMAAIAAGTPAQMVNRCDDIYAREAAARGQS